MSKKRPKSVRKMIRLKKAHIRKVSLSLKEEKDLIELIYKKDDKNKDSKR